MTETCAAYFRSLGWLSFVWCFVAAYFLFINEHGTWWDRCHVDRFMAPPSSQDKMISATTMFCTEIFVFGLNVFLLLWKPSSQAPSVPASPRSPRSPEHLNQLKKEKYLKERLPFINFPLAYDSLYTILWFVATYMIVVFLKNLLDDPTCSVHPNSVSGHTCYFVFHIATLYFLGTYRTPQEDSWRRHVWNSLFLVLVILGGLNLSNTYRGGYHSPRQMLYGAIVGLWTHTACIYPLTRPSTPLRRRRIRSHLERYASVVGLIWLRAFFSPYVHLLIATGFVLVHWLV